MAAGVNILLLKGDPVRFGDHAPYRITRIEGTVSGDSRPLKGDRNVLILDIEGTEGSDTMELSFRGKCTVFYSGRRRYYRGQQLRLSGEIRFNKEREVYIYADKGGIKEAGWIGSIYRLRSGIIQHTGRKISTLNVISSDLLSAFLLGRKDNVSSPVFRDFIRAGTAHLLALSGMHLGIITGFIIVVLLPVFGKKTAFYLSVPVTAFYIFLTGASPSIVRAFIFMLLGGVVHIKKGRADPLILLSVAVVIHLTLSPGSAESLSFRLSYLALAGILLFQKRVSRILPGIIPPGVRGILSASISAQITTIPLSLIYFGTIYPSGIISTVVMAPLVTLFLLTGMLFVLLPFSSGILSAVVNTAGTVLSRTASLFSRIPSVSVPAKSVYPAVLMELLILTMIFLVRYAVIWRNNGASEKLRLGE